MVIEFWQVLAAELRMGVVFCILHSSVCSSSEPGRPRSSRKPQLHAISPTFPGAPSYVPGPYLPYCAPYSNSSPLAFPVSSETTPKCGRMNLARLHNYQSAGLGFLVWCLFLRQLGCRYCRATPQRKAATASQRGMAACSAEVAARTVQNILGTQRQAMAGTAALERMLELVSGQYGAVPWQEGQKQATVCLSVRRSSEVR